MMRKADPLKTSVGHRFPKMIGDGCRTWPGYRS
jgi:hypothetical protein